MTWSWIVQAAAALVVIGGAAAFITKGVRWLLSKLRRLGEFLDDWSGEPARHGRSAVPGVMERLVRLEEGQATTARQVDEIVHEVKPNSGTSLKDQITRIEEHSVPPEARPTS